MIAKTPEPPYYAVIFTSILEGVIEEYGDMAEKMIDLAQQQDGFLGVESAREGIGITVSYWRDLESVRAWKLHSEHLLAQKLGREKWYQSYKLRVALVERDADFTSKLI